MRLPTSRDMQRLLPTKRHMIRITTGKRIREPIPAKRKKEALEKAKSKCQYKRCKIKNNNIKLQFHHINMKNDDNRLSNIMVLCPNHHDLIHRKIKVKVEKDILGREIKRRVIKESKRKPIKRKTKKRRNSIFGDWRI